MAAARFTSSSLGTFIRKAVVSPLHRVQAQAQTHAHAHAHTHAHASLHPSPPPRAPRPYPSGLYNLARSRAQRTFFLLRRLVSETFPSLSTSLPHADLLVHGHAAARLAHASPLASSSFASALSPTARAGSRVRAGWRPPPSFRAGGTQAHVGLGKARRFASAAPSTGSVPANVPIMMRAIVGLLDEDEDGRRAKALAIRYVPCNPRRRATKTTSERSRASRRMRSSCSTLTLDRFDRLDRLRPSARTRALSALAAQFDRYFPLPSPPALQPRLLQPEHLCTPGSTSTLALPLGPPTLGALLSPSPELSYEEAEIGLTIFSALMRDIMPVHTAFSAHASTRVIPLLARLESLGVLGPELVLAVIPAMSADRSPSNQADEETGRAEVGRRHTLVRTTLNVVCDAEGRPEVLLVVFQGRSTADVRRLLGEALKDRDQGYLWSINEVRDESEKDQESENQLIYPDAPVNVWADERSSRLAPKATTAQARDGEGVPTRSAPPQASEWANGIDLVMPVPNDEYPATPVSSYSWPAMDDTASIFVSDSEHDNEHQADIDVEIVDSGLSSEHSSRPGSPISSISPLSLSPTPSSVASIDNSIESIARLLEAERTYPTQFGGMDDSWAAWSEPPSEVDGEIEAFDAGSAFGSVGSGEDAREVLGFGAEAAEAEEMGESVWLVEEEQVGEGGEGETTQNELKMSWTGVGAGFGMPQTW